MEQSKIIIERGKSLSDPVVLQPTGIFDSSRDFDLFQKALLNLAQQKFKKIVLDLQSVPFPSTSFIAFIIEIASRLRRERREFYILHLQKASRMNFSSFSALSFLEEIHSGQDTVHRTNKLETVNPIAEQSLPKTELEKTTEDSSGTQNHMSILEDNFKFDIVEHPLRIREEDLDRPFALYDDDEEPIQDSTNENPFLQQEKSGNYHIVVRSREKELYQITDFVIHHAQNAGFPEADVGKIKIAVYEAAVNVVEHAYANSPHHFVDVIVKYDSADFTIILMDRGKSFDFDKHAEPYSADKAVEQKQTGGFGLYIIKRSMDSVVYESDPVWGNKLTMVKHVPQQMSSTSAEH
ncbi:serine-protein kinase RsbW [bacterium BMS3Bbin03]|nr:serine-protein kinase RsbW [bacterium BMS3Bbin03]